MGDLVVGDLLGLPLTSSSTCLMAGGSVISIEDFLTFFFPFLAGFLASGFLAFSGDGSENLGGEALCMISSVGSSGYFSGLFYGEVVADPALYWL